MILYNFHPDLVFIAENDDNARNINSIRAPTMPMSAPIFMRYRYLKDTVIGSIVYDYIVQILVRPHTV